MSARAHWSSWLVLRVETPLGLPRTRGRPSDANSSSSHKKSKKSHSWPICHRIAHSFRCCATSGPECSGPAGDLLCSALHPAFRFLALLQVARRIAWKTLASAAYRATRRRSSGFQAGTKSVGGPNFGLKSRLLSTEFIAHELAGISKLAAPPKSKERNLFAIMGGRLIQ